MSLRQALLEAELVDTISTSTIGRILSEADFHPHRYRMWVHSPDPDFAVKLRDLVDLYRSAPCPDTAVLCIDEKIGVQALRRRFALRLPAPGEDGRWEFEYRRHAFMDEVVVPAYPTQQVHIVWDNLNTHHGAHWDDFNRRHGDRFRFHYTPIHASWCNQVELWFSILTRRVLRRASFRDVADLVARVMAFIDQWNQNQRKPFRWTFKGYPVQSGVDGRDTS